MNCKLIKFIRSLLQKNKQQALRVGITSLLCLIILVGSFETYAKAASSINVDQVQADVSKDPLYPENFERDIAIFMGLMRTKFENAKISYIHPQSEDQFDYLIEKYGDTILKLFFQGVYPVIKYQSNTSALVLLYNPWNDVLFVSEWQVFDENLLITDLELLTADFLEFDGSPVALVDALWLRLEGETPIDNLYQQSDKRMELFDDLWSTQLGPGNWREVLTSLKSIESIIPEQAVVALRLKNQYLNLMDLTKSEEMIILRKPVVDYLQRLNSGLEGVIEILMDGSATTDETSNIMMNISPELWENSSVQTVLKVETGAFVFVSSPKLPKYFLSFYFEFISKKKLQIKRLDLCSFEYNYKN